MVAVLRKFKFHGNSKFLDATLRLLRELRTPRPTHPGIIDFNAQVRDRLFTIL